MKGTSVFAVIVICVNLSFGASLKADEWSFFVFAQQWPPAACLEVPKGKCLIQDVVKEWTIHGLWPTSEKGYPSFCNSSSKFDPDKLKSILTDLEAKWPNIYADSTENSFWKHEWMKHGTCATTDPGFEDEYQYFKKSLYLHDQYNVFQFLEESGITPTADKPYTVDELEKSILKNLNSTVKLSCKNHKQYSQPIVTSIYICFDKELNEIDCGDVSEPPCDKPNAYYLPFDKMMHLNSQTVTDLNETYYKYYYVD